VRVVELAGGVGGAKLAEGLGIHLGADLTVVVNTGDDLQLYGLEVWPDHDTVLYTLASLDDEARGWGLRDETWTIMDGLRALGEAPWFNLGDRDLATHLFRTERLRAGWRPTDVALALRDRLAVGPTILPMADEPVRTEVRIDDGWLEFQEYFVHRHQEPTVREVRFRGIDAARATPEVSHALAIADVIVIAPSNPIVSIGPILAVAGVRDGLDAARARQVPIIAMSGIIGPQGSGGPHARIARVRIECPGRRAWLCGNRHDIHPRFGRCGCAAGGRGARASRPRPRHDHERRRHAETDRRRGAADRRHGRGVPMISQAGRCPNAATPAVGWSVVP
jgi:LPPG:FO 2-phospho-L-lactate transferase